jgi:hypothetical protein
VAGLSFATVVASAAMHAAGGVFAGAQAPVLPPLPFGLLALATVSIHVIGTGALYLRAHGREPMLPVTLTLAAAVIATLALAGTFATVLVMIAGYTFWILTLGLGGGTYIFLKMRRRWHQPDSSLAA